MDESSVRDVARTADDLIPLWEEVERIDSAWRKRWPASIRWFFRGADKFDHSCDPSLLRPPFLRNNSDLKLLESDLRLDFRTRGHPYHQGQLSPGHTLFSMQHHGFPTRLLDWTTSLPAALHFATRKLKPKSDGAIWIMATPYLMERSGAAGSLQYSIEHVDRYVHPDEFLKHEGLTPVPIFPDRVTPRIAAQGGVFTLHTYVQGELESLANQDRQENGEAAFIHVVRIPEHSKPLFRSILPMLGAMESELFPDLDGLARDIDRDFRIGTEED